MLRWRAIHRILYIHVRVFSRKNNFYSFGMLRKQYLNPQSSLIRLFALIRYGIHPYAYVLNMDHETGAGRVDGHGRQDSSELTAGERVRFRHAPVHCHDFAHPGNIGL